MISKPHAMDRINLFRKISAFIPVLIIISIFALYRMFPRGFDPALHFETHLLLPILNGIFISLGSFAVAYVSARSYLTSGSLNLLFLGCGSLAFGITGLLTGWSIRDSVGQNLSVTIYNCGALLSGILHLAGAIVTPITRTVNTQPHRRMRDLVLCYTGVLGVVLGLLLAGAAEVFPPFLDPANGPTLLRQGVLASAIIFFALSSCLFFRIYAQGKAIFFYWYSIALILIAAGLMGVFFLRSIGDPIAWLGRLAQYFGGIYFFIAVLEAVKAARSRRIPVWRILAELFRKPLELYTTLIQSLSDAVISLDSEGRILLWNPAAERMFGYASDEIIGLPLSDLVVPEEYAVAFARTIEPRPEKGGIDSAGPYEVEAKTKEGKLFHVEVSLSKRWISEQFINTLIIRDITKRKKAEQALKESERKYRHLFASMNEGFTLSEIILDETGKPRDFRILEANPAAEKMAGLALVKEGATAREILPDMDLRWIEIFGVVALTGEPKKIEHYSEKSNRWFDIFAYSPEPNKFATLFVDITERKHAERELHQSREELRKNNESLEMRVRERTAELERSNKELQDFAFIASHDLQEPLRKIQTFGDMVSEKCRDSLSEEGLFYLGRMRSAAARMQQLMRSLLGYSRVSTRACAFAPVNLSDAVQEALSNLEIQIKESRGSVEVGTLPTIEADETQMVQLFQNLISNGLKFSRKDDTPKVRIHFESVPNDAGREPSACRLYVEDNGIGFDQKYLEQIFLPFERLHGRDEYSGVGMGLAICKKIVERHCGTITAMSTPGEGSTFVVTLPLTQGKESRSPSLAQDQFPRSQAPMESARV